MMKKKIILMLLGYLLTLFMPISISAQNSNYLEEELPIIVKRLQGWSKEYPTVINNWNGLLVTQLSGEVPPALAIVTEINGISTRGMDEQSFYEKLMESTEATICYKKKVDGRIENSVCTFSFHEHLFFQDGLNAEWPAALPSNVTLSVDRATEFFRFLTFDIIDNKNSEINESPILEAVATVMVNNGLRRDTENPDLIIDMELQKVEGNGVTCIVNVKDSKRILEGNNKPIWQMQYSGINGNLDRIERVLKTTVVSYCENFPFAEPAYCHNITTLGVAFESEDAMYTGRVVKVLQGCDAYQRGVRDGDQFLSGYYGAYFGSGLWRDTRRYWFKAGKKDGKKNGGVDWYLGILPFWPHFTTNNVKHFLSCSVTGTEGGAYFQIKHNDGTKVRIDAPIKTQTYTYLYLR